MIGRRPEPKAIESVFDLVLYARSFYRPISESVFSPKLFLRNVSVFVARWRCTTFDTDSFVFLTSGCPFGALRYRLSRSDGPRVFESSAGGLVDDLGGVSTREEVVVAVNQRPNLKHQTRWCSGVGSFVACSAQHNNGRDPTLQFFEGVGYSLNPPRKCTTRFSHAEWQCG